MNPDQLAEFEMLFGLDKAANDWQIAGLTNEQIGDNCYGE
jgi:hypothetical protein